VREAAKGRDSAIEEVTKGVSQLRKAAEERDATVAAVSKDIADLRKETSAEVSSMRAGIVKLGSEAEVHSKSVQEVMSSLSEVRETIGKGGLTAEATAELDVKCVRAGTPRNSCSPPTLRSRTRPAPPPSPPRLVGLTKRMAGVEDNVKTYSDRLGKDMDAWQHTLDKDVKTAIEAVRVQTVANSDALAEASREIETLRARAATAAAAPPKAAAESEGGRGLARDDTVALIQETVRPELEALTKRVKTMETAIKSFTEKLESDVESWQVRSPRAHALAPALATLNTPRARPPPSLRHADVRRRGNEGDDRKGARGGQDAGGRPRRGAQVARKVRRRRRQPLGRDVRAH